MNARESIFSAKLWLGILLSLTLAACGGGSGGINGPPTDPSGPPTVTVNVMVTEDVTPPLSGYVSDPTATVQVTVGGSIYTATNNGTEWLVPDNTISPLPGGTYDVEVVATNDQGVGRDTTQDELVIDNSDYVLAEDVIFYDDFSRGYIDNLLWEQGGSTVSLVQDEKLRLNTTVAGDSPLVRSRVIPIRTDRAVLIERRFRVNPGQYAYFGGIKLTFEEDGLLPEDNPGIGVKYVRDDDPDCTRDIWDLYDPVPSECPVDVPGRTHPPLWNQEVHEILVYHPAQGTLKWWINGNAVRTFELPTRNEGSLSLRIEMHNRGLGTGHVHEVDWISVCQSKWNGAMDDGAMYSPISGRVGHLAFTQEHPTHTGTDISTHFLAEDFHPDHGPISDHSWWNGNWPATQVVSGTRVYAAAAGTVIFSGTQGDSGRMVGIEHANGDQTIYAHLFLTLVEVGQQVSPKDAIGIEGNTGGSTASGPPYNGLHLHFSWAQMDVQTFANSPVDWLVGQDLVAGDLILDPLWVLD